MIFVYIAAGVLVLLFIVLLYFTFNTFTRGGSVYDIEQVLKDSPELLERTKRGKSEMSNMTFEDHYITSRDGLALHGKLCRREKDEGKYIICFHGYRSSPEDFMCAMGLFMELGYNILAVDQRSHGNSQGRWITFGVKERYDCLDWCNYAVKTFGEDITVIIDGLSMGATTVLMASALPLPKNVKGVMADCGFTSPWDIVCDVAKKSMHIPKFPLLYLMRPMVRLFAGFGLKEASTVDAVKKSLLPILYIHGLDDDFVPHEMSKRAYEARPENSTLVSVEGAKHGLSFVVDEKRCTEALTEFLTETVKK